MIVIQDEKTITDKHALTTQTNPLFAECYDNNLQIQKRTENPFKSNVLCHSMEFYEYLGREMK